MILTVGNVKGGVGKTTLAVNIAISRVLAGHDVLLVDGRQGQRRGGHCVGRGRRHRLLDVRVVRRKAFPNAAATGRSVVEQAGQDPKAAAELAALIAALYDGACISR